MSIGNRSRGFTLVEALASVALLAVGIVAVMSTFGAMARSEARARESEVMQRLAIDKLHELTATAQATTASSGNFDDRNDSDHQWSVDVQTTGVTDLNAVTVVVSRRDSPGGAQQKVEGLQYVASSTSPGTATPGGSLTGR